MKPSLSKYLIQFSLVSQLGVEPGVGIVAELLILIPLL